MKRIGSVIHHSKLKGVFCLMANRELTEDDKRKFLLFLTGSDRIPVRGMESVKVRNEQYRVFLNNVFLPNLPSQPTNSLSLSFIPTLQLVIQVCWVHRYRLETFWRSMAAKSWQRILQFEIHLSLSQKVFFYFRWQSSGPVTRVSFPWLTPASTCSTFRSTALRNVGWPPSLFFFYRPVLALTHILIPATV